MRLKRFLSLLALLCVLATALPTGLARAEGRYYIEVDITNQMVTVYDSNNVSDSGIVRQMICSTGKNATPTPVGTYSLPTPHSIERKEWYYFSEFNCYAKWATRVVRGILFHSVLYTAKKVGPTKASTKALGSKASHGCIRLRVEDAKWIAENCPGGTTCKIFKSAAKNDALRKRLLNRSFSRDEMTYDAYMGRAEGTSLASTTINLSKGKKGDLVTLLQHRLRALGYTSAPADGKFGATTKTAVNAFLAACGLKQNGKVNNAVWDRMFAADAPTSTLATMTEGWAGPAVAVLQQALADLKVFGGAVDGNFGADTREAVQVYQQCFNLPVTGAADTALQNDAISRAQSVKAQFGATPYQMAVSNNAVTLATVNAKHYTRLRSKPSTKGKKLVRLNRNTQVKVLADDGGAWVQVQYGALTGYVERKFLNMFPGTETVVNYEAVPAPTPMPEVYIPTPDAAAAAPALEIIEEPLPVAQEPLQAEPEPTPAPVPAEQPIEEPAEQSAEQPIEEPAEQSAEQPVEEPAEQSVEQPIEGPAEESAEQPIEEPAEESAEQPIEEPAEQPVEQPIEEPAEQSVEQPIEEPAEEPAVEATVSAPKYAVALAGAVKLYAEPSGDAETVGELGVGEALRVEAVDGDWIAVDFARGIAYLRAAEVALADEPGAAQAEPEIEYGSEPAADPQTAELPEGANGLTVEEE
ncbi:MAG: peptidoglycan-binding protein [Clostridia bacterium]|nr:peptidoglycan-binding protein [Clostridia bacterium]